MRKRKDVQTACHCLKLNKRDRSCKLIHNAWLGKHCCKSKVLIVPGVRTR